jgi:hypothetical protein
MDNRFSWRDQVNCVRRNVGFVLNRLWHFADVTPVMTRKKLVQSLVIPHFLYCDVIYRVLRWRSMVNRRLDVAFNSCARYIFGVSRFRSISSYSSQILAVPWNTYFRRCSIMYLLITTRCPGYLNDRLRMARSICTMNIIGPPFNTMHRSKSFFVHPICPFGQMDK